MIEFKSSAIEFKNFNSLNGSFDGYASVFNVRDAHNDIVLPGSFGKINPSDVQLLFEHKSVNIIGQLSDIQEDKYGLYTKGVIQSKQIIEQIKRGLSGLSIGYKVLQKHIDIVRHIRYIGKIKLYEISLVKHPSNKQAGIVRTNRFYNNS